LINPHDVVVDRSAVPARISFAPTFNLSVALLDRHLAAGRGGKVAVKSEASEMTYAALADGTFRMAAALRGLGVKAGDRVIIAVSDTPAFYFAFLATARLGAIAVPVSTYMKQSAYAYMLADSQAKVVVASPVCLAELAPALQGDGVAVEHRITTGDAPAGWLRLPDLLHSHMPLLEPEPTTPQTECFWLYSSGSTGDPKAAVHQHKDMIYTAIHFAEGVLGINETDLIFSVGKLFFAFGINNSLGFVLWTGATALLMEERVTPENSLAFISRMRPTIYFSVSTLMVQQVAAIENGFAADLSSARVSLGGGEVVPPSLFDNWKRVTGGDLLEAIGSSEALHIYISNQIGHVKRGSLGRAVPGYDVIVADSNGKPLPPGELGEIAIRGDSVATYYWNKPEKTAQCMRDGWFYTGDTAYQDEEGYFYFSGRKDDMLRVGSRWVSPSEVEAALTTHPSVLEAAVISASDQDHLIKPKAFVVLREQHTASPALQEDILAHVRTQLASFKCPKWVAFMPDLPKTATGKIQRFRLRSDEKNSSAS